MSSSTTAAAQAKSVPKLNVVIRWSADPQQICRLLSIIKSNPLWRQACFPQGITTVPKLYKIYIDIFLVFCNNDPAIKAAEREGLVQRVKGSGGKKKWEATERFSSRVGNPVRRKIDSLKSALKSGTYTSTHNFRPSWKSWGDVPNGIRATLQAEHPYYFQLLELAQSSSEFVLPPRSANVEASQSGRKRKLQPSLDVEDDRGPRVVNHKRPRTLSPSLSYQTESVMEADDSGNDDTEPPASRSNQAPSSVPVLSPRWNTDPHAEDDRGPRVVNHKRPRTPSPSLSYQTESVVEADDSGNDDTEPPASRSNQPPSSAPVLSPRWNTDPHAEDDSGLRVGNHKRPRIASPSLSYQTESVMEADDSGNDDTEPPATRSDQPPSSGPVLSPRWNTDPQEVSRLLSVIQTNYLWRQACFPHGGASGSEDYNVYIEIFLRACKDDPVMEVAAREGLVKRLGGSNGGKWRWTATDKFDSQVENPVRTKTSSLMNDFVTGIYESDHGFHPSWTKWTDVCVTIREDLQALHPYYFELRSLVKPSLKVINLLRKCGLVIEGEAAHVSKSERAAADPSTPVLSPSWNKYKKTDTWYLIHCIDKCPRWRRTCFGPSGSTSDSIYKTTCLEIFLFFFRSDPVMERAAKEGLVTRVNGGSGEKPWAATKKFGIIGVVNPVETKLTSLKRDFDAGLYHSHYGFDPNWNNWKNVPNDIMGVLKAKHRYYFKLRRVIEKANRPSDTAVSERPKRNQQKNNKPKDNQQKNKKRKNKKQKNKKRKKQ
ncbi:hypothetical protein L198_07934 [Cryptococcus wingfieldii CBS 7118]|uniref:Uncharacterized protein n=1 Tax=Cryptococcus wingfieldii CBS 7118 TaxID=1295528 RepID=A0A1E3HSC7_9TREE|nr:hypothetical protein L198_07934 [Cryptococcus wingfieldii CBS 7118]ODN79055.1 hypothetical protein L198_07934 [Cryptococcus wingfieldii CBS 7118]